MLHPVNLKEKLALERSRAIGEASVLQWVQQVFDELDRYRSQVIEKLESPKEMEVNTFQLYQLEKERMYHIDQIKKVCIQYRLRFLPTKYFKGTYPETVINKIKELEDEHTTQLDGFRIIAPSKLFVLKKADDPLLFVPIGNDYYYLIHAWGKDLHPLRRLKVWPLKNLSTMTITSVVFSLIVTLLFKDFVFNNQATPAYVLVLFLFVFKFTVGFILFYGISSGKNFNELIWQSNYDKVQ